MKATFYGHSVVLIETMGKKIMIDPFITGNDSCNIEAKDVKVDAIILTHGHNDHVGDTLEIATRCDALVVGPYELATHLGSKGVTTHPMHIGGAYQFDFGRVKLTQAFHGSGLVEENGAIIYTGMPAGILFTSNGKTLYHAGDTALFSDMKLIGDRNKIDLAFLPIGDNFTMGPEDAALAAEWLQTKIAVPIHYNTFPVIKQNPDEFVSLLREGIEGKVLKSGQSLEL